MLGRLEQKLEDWMAAAAFAEAGEHEAARKRVRRGKRLELRAPGSRR